jgi:hypothetical protein
MPAVDQPFMEVDGKEVDKMFVFHFSTMAWYTAATLPLLLSFTRNSAYATKRNITGVSQYIHKERERSSQKD